MECATKSSFVGVRPHKVSWLSSLAAGGPRELVHTIPFAMCGWCEDQKAYLFRIMAWDVDRKHLEQSSLNAIDSFVMRGAATNLQGVDLGDGVVQILAATSEGGIYESVLERDEDTQKLIVKTETIKCSTVSGSECPRLQPWLELHKGPVTVMDVCQETHQVVTGGVDGRLNVFHLRSTPAANAFNDSKGLVGYNCGKWVEKGIFAVSSSAAAIQLWDTRDNSKAAKTSPAKYGPTGGSKDLAARGTFHNIHCIDVHPARPYQAVTGGSDGSVVLWDLRFEREPVSLVGADSQHGDIWQVQFEFGEPFVSCNGSFAPAASFSTQAGDLVWIGDQRGPPSSLATPQQQVYFAGTSPIKSFDIETSFGGRLVMCALDNETIVCMSRNAGKQW